MTLRIRSQCFVSSTTYSWKHNPSESIPALLLQASFSRALQDPLGLMAHKCCSKTFSFEYLISMEVCKPVEVSLTSISKVCFYLCACVWSIFIYVHHIYAVAHRSQKTHQFLQTGISGGCELACRCWKLNLGPL